MKQDSLGDLRADPDRIAAALLHCLDRCAALEAGNAKLREGIDAALDENMATKVLKLRIGEQNDEIAALRERAERAEADVARMRRWYPEPKMGSGQSP